MDRVNIVDPPETNIGEITSWRELRAAISSFHRQHPKAPLSNSIELANICREWFTNIGASDEFDASDPKAIEELITIIDGEIEAEEEAIKLHQEENIHEFDSKALDAQRLEILLDEFDKHQSIKNAEELLRELSKNPVLHEVDRKAIRKIIDQKILLQNEAIKRGEPLRVADAESDLQIIVQTQLEEAGVDSDKAEKIAISAATIAVKSDSLEESREINKVLVTEKIDSNLIKFVEQTTVNKTAEIIVAIQEERIVDNLITKLKTDYSDEITATKEKQIREITFERLDLELRESLPKANEKQILTKNGKTEAKSLTDDIVTIIGREGDKDKVGIAAKEVEKEADRVIGNLPEVVGVYRKTILEREIRAELILEGVDSTRAVEKATYWGEFIYPSKHEAEMVETDETSIKKGEENGYQGENLKLAARRAQVITRLVTSDKSVKQNVSDMLINGEGIDNKVLFEYKDIAKQLNTDNGATRSLEYIRGVINFRKRFDNLTGKGVIQLGRIVRSERLQQWGQNIINRIGVVSNLGEFSTAATTWFAWAQNNQLGIHWALNKISDAWLGAGLKPIQFGSILEKIGGNSLTGLGKNIFTGAEVAIKKGGINALGALKGLATKFAPKLAASLGKLALTAAAWPLAILTLFDLKEIFKLITYVIGGVFIALFLVIPLLTMGSMSSIVPTKGDGLGQEIDVGHVDERGNTIIGSGKAAPGLPAGFLSGAEYDVSSFAIAQTYKQCGGPWAGTVLPNDATGTVCSSGCGPSSVSMVVSRFNGACTPDKMYTDINCGANCYVGSGRGGTGVYQNFCALNKFLPGMVSITACSSAIEIANFIKAGNMVMVLADFYVNSGGGTGGHYFLASGVKDGKIVVKDPYYPKANPFDGKVEYGSIYKVLSCILIKG